MNSPVSANTTNSFDKLVEPFLQNDPQFLAYQKILASLRNVFGKIEVDESLTPQEKFNAVIGLKWMAFHYSSLVIENKKTGKTMDGDSFVGDALGSLNASNQDLSKVKIILTDAVKNIGQNTLDSGKKGLAGLIARFTKGEDVGPIREAVSEIEEISKKIYYKSLQDPHDTTMVADNPLFAPSTGSSPDPLPPFTLQTSRAEINQQDRFPHAFSPQNNIFTGKTHTSFEIQRREFLEAAKILAAAAFGEIGGEKWAEEIVADYEQMYSSGGEKDVRRVSHDVTHPLLHIVSFEAQKVLLSIHNALTPKGEDSDEARARRKILASTIAKSAVANDHSLSIEMRNKFRHDLVQVGGVGWQKEVMTLLRNKGTTWTVGDLVANNTKKHSDPSEQDLLKQAGFDGSPEMNDFVQLAARLFFPDGNDGYNANKSFEHDPASGKFDKGGAEFLSAVYSYRREFIKGKDTPNFAEQLSMIIFLRGTIPFEKQDEFQTIYNETSKMLLKPEERVKLTNSFSEEFKKECKRESIASEDMIEYWLTKQVSAACDGANHDVMNFFKSILALYYGDRGLKSEMGTQRKFLSDLEPQDEVGRKRLSDLEPQDRLNGILEMIDDHRDVVGPNGKKGFVYQKAEDEMMCHSFKSEKYPHFNVLGKYRVQQMHKTYKLNAAKVVQMHKADLIQAAVEILFGKDKDVDFHSMTPEKLTELADKIKTAEPKLSKFKMGTKCDEELQGLKAELQSFVVRKKDIGYVPATSGVHWIESQLKKKNTYHPVGKPVDSNRVVAANLG